jgi:hypothetical protein
MMVNRTVPLANVLFEVANVNLTRPQTRPFHGAGSLMVKPPVVELVGAVTVK